MKPRPNLIERIERLSGKYAIARRELEGHPQYQRLQEITREELPADLVQMIQQYETALKGLEEERIVIPSIVKLKETVSFSIDHNPADNGNKKIPEGWFDYWEKDSSHRIMASAGDLYQGWKQLKRNSQSANGDEVRRASAIVAGFRDDFDWLGQKNYLVGGTYFAYQPDTLDATVTQHYRCKRKELVKTTPLQVEEYLGVPIAEVVAQEKGLRYLQVFFDTEDDAETIMQTLEFISDKKRDEIKVWTPPLKSGKYVTRKQHPNRAAGFNYVNDYFHVYGSGISGAGRSRGVAVE
ncbi:hypothetical protein HYX13_04645 [Candidatus Woesearchaeota archaeon]|nr:hypothetical protein [Candidatus Woesearchaeota archaeon]